MQREVKLAFLQASLHLPLTDAEMALMRVIAHHYALGTEREWGMNNQHRYQEVEALFIRCKEMFASVSPAHV